MRHRAAPRGQRAARPAAPATAAGARRPAPRAGCTDVAASGAAALGEQRVHMQGVWNGSHARGRSCRRGAHERTAHRQTGMQKTGRKGGHSTHAPARPGRWRPRVCAAGGRRLMKGAPQSKELRSIETGEPRAGRPTHLPNAPPAPLARAAAAAAAAHSAWSRAAPASGGLGWRCRCSSSACRCSSCCCWSRCSSGLPDE